MTAINPIWSIVRALAAGYVMEPHRVSGNFFGELRMSRPSHECALHIASIYRAMHDKGQGDCGYVPACVVQCAECAEICYMNDYIRGKPHCPPHYPVPALPMRVSWGRRTKEPTINSIRWSSLNRVREWNYW